MGATLPAIARWVETTPPGVSWLGFFYGGNIAGAVFGCLLAGFYLLRVHDMATATFVAVGDQPRRRPARLARCAASTGVRRDATDRRCPTGIAEPRDGATRRLRRRSRSRACARSAAEVVWTRVLSLMLGATMYTFSIILAVFLIGLGIGSSLGRSSRGAPRPRVALGRLPVLLAGVAIAWTAFMLGDSLPYWPINPWLSTSPWFTVPARHRRGVPRALLPAAFLWGASFPLALAAGGSARTGPGPAGRRRLRRQHGRCDRRRGAVQPAWSCRTSARSDASAADWIAWRRPQPRLARRDAEADASQSRRCDRPAVDGLAAAARRCRRPGRGRFARAGRARWARSPTAAPCRPATRPARATSTSARG